MFGARARTDFTEGHSYPYSLLECKMIDNGKTENMIIANVSHTHSFHKDEQLTLKLVCILVPVHAAALSSFSLPFTFVYVQGRAVPEGLRERSPWFVCLLMQP